jgi:hypothetical protein
VSQIANDHDHANSDEFACHEGVRIGDKTEDESFNQN